MSNNEYVTQERFGSTFFWDSEPRPIGQPVSGTEGQAFYHAIGNEWVTVYEGRMEQARIEQAQVLEAQARQAELHRAAQDWIQVTEGTWFRPREGWLPDRTQEIMDKFPETTEY